MSVTELIIALRSGQQRRIMAAAEAAADALEVLEERIAIMSEALTAEEWERQEQEARKRIAAAQMAAAPPAQK